jgi:hypothetical protein
MKGKTKGWKKEFGWQDRLTEPAVCMIQRSLTHSPEIMGE